MIEADRLQLESQIRQLSLNIRSKELSMFLANMRVLGTKATFMCGIGFGMLHMKPSYLVDAYTKDAQDLGFRQGDSPIEIFFISTCCVSIGLSVLVMTTSSWSIIFGQDLAYRGQDGSLARAVEGLYVERKHTLRLFYTSTAFLILSAMALGWLKTTKGVTAVFVVVLPAFAAFIVYFMRWRVRRRFKFPAESSRRPSHFTIASYDPEALSLRSPLLERGIVE